MSERVQTYLNLFRFNMIWIDTIYITTWRNTLKFEQMQFSNMLKHVWTCWNMSEHVQTCLNLFRFNMIPIDMIHITTWRNTLKFEQTAQRKFLMTKWFLGSIRASWAIKKFKLWLDKCRLCLHDWRFERGVPTYSCRQWEYLERGTTAKNWCRWTTKLWQFDFKKPYM